MGGLGAAMMVKGAAAGVQDVVNQNEQAQQQQTRDQLQQQQLQENSINIENAQHQQQRNQVLEARQDEAYNTAHKARVFQNTLDDAMRQFVGSGGQNYQGLVDAYNSHFPNGGAQMLMSRNPDGTYNMVVKRDGKVAAEHDNLSYDQVGQLAMGMRNPETYFTALQAQNAKTADRQFQLDKMKTEYGLKQKLEAYKAGLPGGAGGKVPDYQTKAWQMASSEWGSKNPDGTFSFNTPDAKNMASYTATLSTALWQSGSHNAVDNNNRAMRTVQGIEGATKQQTDQWVKQQTQAGKPPTSDQIVAYQTQLMDQKVLDASAEVLRRTKGQPASGSGSGGLQAPGGNRNAAPQSGSPSQAGSAGVAKGESRQKAPTLDVWTRAFLEKNPTLTGADAKKAYQMKYGSDGAAENATGKAAASQTAPATAPQAAPPTAPAPKAQPKGGLTNGPPAKKAPPAKATPQKPIMFNGKPLQPPPTDAAQSHLGANLIHNVEATAKDLKGGLKPVADYVKGQIKAGNQQARAQHTKAAKAALKHVREQLNAQVTPTSYIMLQLALDAPGITPQETTVIKQIIKRGQAK